MLSIIIPTLNAETTLPATLDAVFAPRVPELDVVVVDGGSTDATCHVAEEHEARVLDSPSGRGRQLAAGARAAKHDWLLFLHADTRLPGDWEKDVARFMTADRNHERAGYFDLNFNDASSAARRVAALANWRSRQWGLPYGDQGLLIHRDLYLELGGFREDLDIMEDVDLARRLGPMRLKPVAGDGFNPAVTTSAAKYADGGWWARPFKNLTCLFLFLAGAPMGWIERLQR